jgi:hypothetical protein
MKFGMYNLQHFVLRLVQNYLFSEEILLYDNKYASFIDIYFYEFS